MEATEALAMSLSIVFKQSLGSHEVCKLNRVMALLSSKSFQRFLHFLEI